ncbi:MAG TPA: 4-hydroxybenzoate octaprenyltransferase [Holosporales bacterium]|nr:4-hydroxybenzoate octaprenyltransferase [Holosporales bacterium]
MNSTLPDTPHKNQFIESKRSAYINLSRILRPTGIILLWIPCLWGLALQTNDIYSFLYKSLVYLLGATSLRTVGCIINDIADKDFDAQVTRTKQRPLAAGTLSIKEAIIFAFICLIPGLYVFTNLPPANKMIGLLGLTGAFIYPLCKRFTNWPQLMLGLLFNIGIWIIGYGSIPVMNLIALYTAGICWTLAYDTIYAFQDLEDDLIAGVKSTAVRFKNAPKLAITLFYTGMMLALAALGYMNNASLLYYVSLVLLSVYLTIYLYFWNHNNTKQCLQFFKDNQMIGMSILFLLLLLIF